MWYKTAKYGTLWDRLGPESEQEIDRILDESTIREKTIDPTTNTEKEVRKIDYKKLDQLLKKSVLGEKGVLNKIIEFHDPKYGGYNGIWIPNDGSIPLIQTKILNIPILIRNYMNKVIHINPVLNKSYFLTRGVIKHEISHAISSAVLPASPFSSTGNSNEFYLSPGKLSKNDIGNNITETHYKIKFNSIN